MSAFFSKALRGLSGTCSGPGVDFLDDEVERERDGLLLYRHAVALEELADAARAACGVDGEPDGAHGLSGAAVPVVQTAMSAMSVRAAVTRPPAQDSAEQTVRPASVPRSVMVLASSMALNPG